MASIEPHAGGYRIRYREGGRGTPNKASITFATKREAVQAKADIERMLAARRKLGGAAGTRLPFDQVVARWGDARPVPDAAYVKEAKAWLLPLAKDRSWQSTADITPQAVGEWKMSMGYRNSRRWAVLRAVLRWAAEHLEQPVDTRSLVQLRPKQSRRAAPTGLLPDTTVAAHLAGAAKLSASCGALVHCLSLYGWRPVTAARMHVGDVDLARMRINLGVLKGGNPWHHPIFPATAERLKFLIGGRTDDAPLFTAPRTGDGWSHRDGIRDWWHRLTKGRVYDLKRYAITAMRRGRSPWARPLTVSEIQLFTGHLTASQVLVYMRADVEDLAEIMRCAPGVHEVTPGAETA